MREIAIRCPKTGLPVRTGMFSATYSFRIMKVRGTVRACPGCGKDHNWTSDEGWLIETEAKSQRTII